MYMDDVSYSEICATLGIGDYTAREWRRKLGLPVRLGYEPVSWMDVKNLNGLSPRQVVERVAGAFGIRAEEIRLILTRFDKLRQKGKSAGRNLTQLLLTAVYEYLRWPPSRKQPQSPTLFAKVCQDKGFAIRRSNLLSLSRLYKEAGLFPPAHLTAAQLLEIRWPVLMTRMDLPAKVRSVALAFISEVKFEGKSPEGAVAASLFTAARILSLNRAQSDFASFFGITEVTVRHAIVDIYAYYESMGQNPTVKAGLP
ncbi:MAG: hypothetical protein HY247_08375 [archaeon]|nr:MAG: hypothetical protein HY247_08375 [archaeon]